MSWEFRPGMRVVCINDSYTPEGRLALAIHNIQKPKKGRVYTIRDVMSEPIQGHLVVRLVEIVNAPAPYINSDIIEPFYLAKRFRPLDEKRLDVFRQHLVPAPRERATL